MKENLKNIFEKNKEFLFDGQLSENHLEKFEERLEKAFPQKKKMYQINQLQYIGIAASILFIITLNIFIYVFNNKNEMNDSFTAAPNKEIKESEDFFAMAVQQKINTLKTYENSETKPYIDKCLQSLEKLDRDYVDLKKDFRQTGSQKVLDLMLNNLNQRVTLLNDLIKQLKYYKNKSYEL